MVWTLDHIAIAAPLFGALIRFGNFMNSEIIGNVTDAPWGVIFVQAGETLPRHPAQLYEAIAYLVIFFTQLLLYKKLRNRMGNGFFLGHPFKPNRHQKRTYMVIGDAFVGHALDEIGDLLLVKLASLLFFGDDVVHFKHQ